MTEPRMNKLLNFPHAAYLMVRLDYVLICESELEAKILRIVEMFIDEERKKRYKDAINDGLMPDDHEVKIPKDIWMPISYHMFMYELYGTVTSENTLKKAIRSLVNKKFIFTRHLPKSRYDAPEYQINIEVVQGELDKLQQQGKQGYQKMMPSKNDALKNLAPQKLTPSEHQDLIPSPSAPSTTRVSEIDTNRISNSKKKLSEEQDNSAAVAVVSPSPQKSPSQESLLEAPLTEPQMTGSWDHEKVVQYAEWCHGKRYTAKQREEQLKAAKKLHAYNKDYTLEQFKLAFDTRNDDWWSEHQGRLDVNDLSAKGGNGSLRMEDMLKRLEKGNKSQLRVVSPPQEQERPSVLVPKRQSLINFMNLFINAGSVPESYLNKFNAAQAEGIDLPLDKLERVRSLPIQAVRSNAL